MTDASDAVEKAVKALVFDVALKAIIAQIITKAPFLAWPVINPVFIYAITKVVELAYDEMIRVAGFIVIDFKTEMQRDAYEDARDELREELKKPERDEAAIAKAKEEFKKRLADLIRFPNAQPA